MATLEEDIERLNLQCKKIVNGEKSMDDAIELIETLEQIPVTIKVLTDTRIGITINDLRKKTNDERLAKRAKALIKKWKNIIDSVAAAVVEKNANSGSKANNKSASNGRSEAADGYKSTTKRDSPPSDDEEPPAKKPSVSNSSSAPTSFKRVTPPTDQKRQKTVSVLTSSLRGSGEYPDGTQDPEDVALRIEAALFEEHGLSEAYYAAVRSRASNLRDKKNPGLRENVLIGVVSPNKFARMSTQEMASDEMKKQREEFTKESILEHQMAVQEGTPSDMFRCGRCGKNNCTYNQMQTRSADEPMTTFVFCRTCGNRWKFC
ncbi:hypothetical protein M3Y94_00470300 [Aphelenchoides besseyi]|nr:hypothetical protein M3Y94_00470300 [Aphelenchoides besseyi]